MTSEELKKFAKEVVGVDSIGIALSKDLPPLPNICTPARSFPG